MLLVGALLAVRIKEREGNNGKKLDRGRGMLSGLRALTHSRYEAALFKAIAIKKQ